MQYKAVIFDLDGTLINSLDDLADSANAMLESYGYPTFPVERYRYFVGNGSRKLIERVLPEAKRTPEFIDEALAKYKGIYEKNILTKTRPYAGILEMLATLRQQGIPLGLCTNKHQEAAMPLSAGFSRRGPFSRSSAIGRAIPGNRIPPRHLKLRRLWEQNRPRQPISETVWWICRPASMRASCPLVFFGASGKRRSSSSMGPLCSWKSQRNCWKRSTLSAKNNEGKIKRNYEKRNSRASGQNL